MGEIGETDIAGWAIGVVVSAFLAFIITLVASWPIWGLPLLFIIFLSIWVFVRKRYLT
mgnify:FL=1